MNTESRLVVVLLGGPGAGKGTQAEIVVTWLRIPHISTGQMLRSEIAQETKVGKRVRTLVESGAFVDDATIDGLIANRIRLPDCRDGFILDGYPRNIRQAVAFDKELRSNDRLIVIDISTDPVGIIERLKRRGRCDDREDVIRPRLETYRRETIPVAEFYKQRGLYQKVDGMKPLEVVAESIAAILRSLATIACNSSREDLPNPIRATGNFK
jgi:adenylate kinase